jgi:hypothetical protein
MSKAAERAPPWNLLANTTIGGADKSGGATLRRTLYASTTSGHIAVLNLMYTYSYTLPLGFLTLLVPSGATATDRALIQVGVFMSQQSTAKTYTCRPFTAFFRLVEDLIFTPLQNFGA